MNSKPLPIARRTWLAAMVSVLLGLYLPASVLTAYPNLHHHSGASSAPENETWHGNASLQGSQEGSHEDSHESPGSDAPAPHGHENCQICLIQSTLAHSIPPTAPDIRLLIQVRAFLVLPCASFVPQVLIAGVQSRGPPAFLPA